MDEVKHILDFPGYEFYASGKIKSTGSRHTLGSEESNYIICNMKDKDGKIRKCRLHRMIYWAFSGNDPVGMEVDHIDRNTHNNTYSNLQLLSKSDHRKKTHAENPGHNATSSEKRAKSVIGIDPDGVSHTFLKISDANAFLGKDLNNGFIGQCCKYGTTYCGWTFKWNKSDMHKTCEWKKVALIGCEQDIYVNDEGYIKTKRVVTKGNLSGGYYKFSVKYNNKNIYKGVHELICTAFHGPKPDWATSVNHIDRDRTNNKPENLEWSTASLQVHHALSTQITLMNVSDNSIKKFNSLSEAASSLQLSNRRMLQTAWINDTEILGFKVIDLQSKQRNQRQRSD